MHNRLSLLNTLIFILLHFCAVSQNVAADALPRSTPEAEGVSSEGIRQFVDAAEASTHELHSFMVLRHGKVVAEGWWHPYRPDLKHTMYSCSKSFTATAIGFAVSEKRLTVNDKVISFFPDDVPANISPNLAALRVRDLLSMSVGQEPDPTPVIRQDSNWVRAFLAAPIVHPPGSKFLYNSLATYVLSAIVQKVTGQTTLDYLAPRLFEPLGIRGMDWENDPQGINVGGWGLRLKTEDMAKFGQLFLQKGRWNGRQILPEAWVEEASTLKIVQHPDLPQAKKDSSDWEQGYAYQMWRSRHNSYRGDGAYGQFIMVLPELDAVVVGTAETHDMQGEFNLVWKYLLPALRNEPVPANKKTTSALRQKLATLALPVPPKTAASPLAKEISGKTLALSPNAQFLQQIDFQFKNEVCNVVLNVAGDTFHLAFSSGKWAFGQTAKRPPSLTQAAMGYFVGLPASKVAGAYRWATANTLELTLRYIETPHTEIWTFQFDGNAASLDIQSSQNRSKKQMKGALVQSPAKPIRLIVRGDDMGFSHAANEALIKSSKEGIQTSIEVIVPSPWFPEAVSLLAQNPGIDVGIHLALTSEWDNVKWRPLSDCPSLRNADGYFYPMVFPNKNYPGQSISENKWTLADVEKEFRAQIEMGLKKIPRVSHISAHMGCTRLSDEVLALIKRLAVEYKIPVEPETEYQGYVNYDGPHTTLAEKKQSFLSMLAKLEPGKTYLFLDHPAFDNSEMQAIHHVGYENVATDRQGVTDLFTDPEIKAFIRKNGIQLIGYKDL